MPSNFDGSCKEAPVAQKLRSETIRLFGGSDAGIRGNDAHCGPWSSHNCGPCGQESSLNGVSYDPRYAHAWDWSHKGQAHRYDVGRMMINDPRTRYIIMDGRVYYGVVRGGGTGPRVGGHTSHWHWSGMPGTTFMVSDFYGSGGGGVVPSGPSEEDKWRALQIYVNALSTEYDEELQMFVLVNRDNPTGEGLIVSETIGTYARVVLNGKAYAKTLFKRDGLTSVEVSNVTINQTRVQAENSLGLMNVEGELIKAS